MITFAIRRLLLAITSVVFLWQCAQFKKTADGESLKKRNIIIVMADDLCYNDSGCCGKKKIQIPNTDRLAVEGGGFTRIYSGSAVCAPSRSVLVTGKPGLTSVSGNSSPGIVSPYRSSGLQEAHDQTGCVLNIAYYLTYSQNNIPNVGFI